jgi:hypothetical protein
VRVNDPAGDGIGDQDMTTQSETTVAVSGPRVLVAYNDSGHSSPTLKAADDLSGYSWSDDHGATWHDGELPNHYPSINLGDPVLAADRAGHFYYASLALDASVGSIGVAVGRSDDGGQSFATPRFPMPPPDFSNARTLTLVDKPWMTVGPDPDHPGRDVVYVSWSEFRLGFGIGTRIRMSESRDQGRTWSRPVTVASANQGFESRQFVTLTGSSLVARPSNGSLFVAFERIVESRRGGSRAEIVTRSGDRGRTFSKLVKAAAPRGIGEVIPACGEVLPFGEGRLARVQEFPMLALGPNGTVAMTYNTEGQDGHSHVVVASSADAGRTWNHHTIPVHKDAFMPAIGGGASGLSVVFYERLGKLTMQASVATSTDGQHFTVGPLSSSTFPAPVTAPSTDPLLATCYMGDYLAASRVGGVTYAAWGDNRDVVVNDFWPNGRPDPDVYFKRF